VIPTRLLTENADILPALIAIVTGVVFPFLDFLTRKAMLVAMGKYLLGKLHRGEIDKDRYLRTYNRTVKFISVGILLVPRLLMYLNRTITYAILSAIAQIVTEVVAKCVIAYTTKTKFKLQRENIDETQLNQVELLAASVTKRITKREKKKSNGDDETQLNFALGMLALRWNAETVGEKR